jgi:hypothetical protein
MVVLDTGLLLLLLSLCCYRLRLERLSFPGLNPGRFRIDLWALSISGNVESPVVAPAGPHVRE